MEDLGQSAVDGESLKQSIRYGISITYLDIHPVIGIQNEAICDNHLSDHVEISLHIVYWNI